MKEGKLNYIDYCAEDSDGEYDEDSDDEARLLKVNQINIILKEKRQEGVQTPRSYFDIISQVVENSIGLYAQMQANVKVTELLEGKLNAFVAEAMSSS